MNKIKNLKQNNLFIAICVIVSTVFVGCKEEPLEADFSTPPSQTSRLFATTNLATEATTYNFDVSHIETQLNTKFNSTDRFVIESIEVIDNNLLSVGAAEPLEFKLCYIDTQEETSKTMWLTGDFLTKNTDNQNAYYHWNQDVVSGTYDIAYNDGGRVYVAQISGANYTISEMSPDDIVTAARWAIRCMPKHNCTTGCSKTGFFNAGCGCKDTSGGGYCDGEHRNIVGFILDVVSFFV